MPGKRLALLVANAEYQHAELRKLNSPHDDVLALEALLGRPDIGGYEIQVLSNGSKSVVERAIDRTLTDSGRDDTVLIFFAGHGLKHEDGTLYFAAADSEPDYLDSTAISAGWLVRKMQISRVGCQIVLLDCCFGGAFARGHLWRGDRVESGKALEVPDLKYSGRGQVVITAADAMQFAFEGAELDGKPPASHFMRALTHGLETGEADSNGDGRITVDELANYLETKLKTMGSPQRPSKWTFGAVGGDLLFALNPRANVASEIPLAATKPLNLITITIISRSSMTDWEIMYQVDFRTLGIFKTFYSVRFIGDPKAYTINLYNKIKDSWINSGRDVVGFNAELRAYGAELFEELFPEQLQRFLWDSRDRISQILLVSTDSFLSFLPWEIVYLKEPDQPISDGGKFLCQLGLVRWLESNWPPEELHISEGTAFYIIPDYPDSRSKLPEAQKDKDFLSQTFHAKPLIPTPKDVRKCIMDGNVELLHFTGHGEAESNDIMRAKILLEGRVESGQYIPAYLKADEVRFYGNFSRFHPIVVFDVRQADRGGDQPTSLGAFAKAFLERGAGAFVGCLWWVGNRPSCIFTETWYDMLLSGSTLTKAVTGAREAAREAGDPAWLTYTVYGHPSAKLVRR